ncbi:MAG: hypothetical protein BroJett040_21930 [Oligoflexia bacterium]|nr:MAG: hypothetical protein BroJett040_21930 [Oligoflexia bacterium]
MKPIFALILVSATLFGCASQYQNPSLNLRPESDYYSSVEKNTAKKQIYDGFMNTLDASATLMTSDLQRLQVDQNARIYQWNQDQYNNEKSKVESEMTKSTEVFLSFFVPERKHDDLHKASTKWKIFLDAAGKRVEGKATKMKILLAEAQTLYPHHTRWGTPYKLSFPIPTSLTENGNAKVTLTGPVGSTTFEFQKLIP